MIRLDARNSTCHFSPPFSLSSCLPPFTPLLSFCHSPFTPSLFLCLFTVQVYMTSMQDCMSMPIAQYTNSILPIKYTFDIPFTSLPPDASKKGKKLNWRKRKKWRNTFKPDLIVFLLSMKCTRRLWPDQSKSSTGSKTEESCSWDTKCIACWSRTR